MDLSEMTVEELQVLRQENIRLVAILDSKQKAAKTLMNSLYGALG